MSSAPPPPGRNRSRADDVEGEIAVIDQKLKLVTPLLATVTNYKSVTRLILCHNSIDNLPLDLFDLENLEHLNLCNNSIREIPAAIGNLQRWWLAVHAIILGLKDANAINEGGSSFTVWKCAINNQNILCSVNNNTAGYCMFNMN